MDINEVKDRLLQLGYEAKEGDDTALLFCISRTEEHIKNVCNISEIPEELYYKGIDMVCGEFLGVKLEGYGTENDRLIKTITEGDTTVTYQDGVDRVKKLIDFINGLRGNDAELYSFRKMRW